MSEDGVHTLDATDSVLVYENGKTMACPSCDERVGTDKNSRFETCHFCNATFVDEEWDERSDEEWLEAGTKPEDVEESGGEEGNVEVEQTDAMDW